MRRRRVLSALSLAIVGVAGCTSGPSKSGPKWGPPETEPEMPTEDESTVEPTATTTSPGYGLRAEFTYLTTTATDAFAIAVTVRNTIDEPRTAVLVVTWSRDDETRVEKRRVSLDVGGSTTFELTFSAIGDLSFDWRTP
jgi:hypothetical protein